MPWKKSEPMEQRIEFALKALQSLNFRALCQEYGISAKTGYKWKERFLRERLGGMEELSRPAARSRRAINRRGGVRDGALEAGA
jgi:putative transposase